VSQVRGEHIYDMLRRKVEPEREEIDECWRTFRTEEPMTEVFSSSDINSLKEPLLGKTQKKYITNMMHCLPLTYLLPAI
jgi:hypothetical protein